MATPTSVASHIWQLQQLLIRFLAAPTSSHRILNTTSDPSSPRLYSRAPPHPRLSTIPPLPQRLPTYTRPFSYPRWTGGRGLTFLRCSNGRCGWTSFYSIGARRDGVVMVLWWCHDGAMMVPWWCRDGALTVPWWHCDGAVMVLWWCRDGAVSVVYSFDNAVSVVWFWWCNISSVALMMQHQ